MYVFAMYECACRYVLLCTAAYVCLSALYVCVCEREKVCVYARRREKGGERRASTRLCALVRAKETERQREGERERHTHTYSQERSEQQRRSHVMSLVMNQ